ncbi:TPA: hypothetical protein JIZ13_02470 [Acinetobacter nosocomialis]|uniref:Uncharacterized protein n=1 Tax=Acinetobacter nosocomialis TaxID=106654 RepID=A0A2L1VEX0_ACINO|nr:hypothetical protein RR32_06890 [Acinetobacter nosocomialis]ARG17020.1 hypothetical protein B7L44_10700 [Acinetobacter nosocomialis]AVF43782.1 hypothetical protein AL533_04985 [Acinetobacter nosocomialis]AWL18806.1 hypothetical protein DIW83_07110 [Acinetobacter nosocomialis]QGA44546.1 hypothetical protein GD578_12210 [Acinetobacter nosocomialis]
MGKQFLFIKQLPFGIAKICKQIMEPQKKITEFRLVVIPTPPFSCGYRAINIVLYLLNQDFFK